MNPELRDFFVAARKQGVSLTRFLFAVQAELQTASLYEQTAEGNLELKQTFRCSTSKFCIDQRANTNGTPLGLHRVAQKIGDGCPVGTIFKSRKVVGYTWEGNADAAITTRILWLEGLEPGFNQGGEVDTFSRYIYIHGTGDESTIGKPSSHGCVHLAAEDLVPLYDLLPVGTLVWISRR